MTFSGVIPLTAGVNTLEVTLTNQVGDKISDVKRTLFMDSLTTPLAITDPSQDMITTSSSLTITGTVGTSCSGITVKLSVNGTEYTPAVNSDGRFSLALTLSEDKIYAVIATATDLSGHTSVVQRNIVRKSSNGTNAKVYLGSNDSITLTNSGTTVCGGTGDDTVTIAAGATGVTLDQNVERINLSGSSSNYTFKQTGNKINVYDIAGTTLLVNVPVQGDTDGTLLSFSYGMASVKLAAGVMMMGNAPVSSTAATPLTPALTPDTPVSATTTKAKVYLGLDDSFTVSNGGATLYGGTGKDTVTITSGVAGVTLDQNVERLNLSGASGSYAFKQTGNKINVYDATGTTLLASVPVQGDSDGTVIGFSDGYASAKLVAGVMTLGGATVGPGVPGVIEPVLTP